jgi:hypothetical protein
MGHSGGGTLALLLAEQFTNTRAIITLAGNLDTDAWTAWHAYTPLRGSLNPALRPSLPASMMQRHYLGAQDGQIPPGLARRFAARHPEARVMVVPEQDHACCWSKIWPGILNDLEKRLKGRID